MGVEMPGDTAVVSAFVNVRMRVKNSAVGVGVTMVLSPGPADEQANRESNDDQPDGHLRAPKPGAREMLRQQHHR